MLGAKNISIEFESSNAMNALHLKDGLYPFDGVSSSVERGNRQSAKWRIACFSVLFHSVEVKLQMSRTISTSVLMADTSVSSWLPSRSQQRLRYATEETLYASLAPLPRCLCEDGRLLAVCRAPALR
jgi:hypothetical protein